MTGTLTVEISKHIKWVNDSVLNNPILKLSLYL